MSAPIADPSQVFADPAQMDAMQGPGPPPDQPQAQPPEQQTEQPPIDLEGSIAHAIEVGCDMAAGATAVSAEDFMRFAQGVSYLADAFAKLQPSGDPADAAVAAAHVRANAQRDVAASRPTPPQT